MAEEFLGNSNLTLETCTEEFLRHPHLTLEGFV